MLFILLMFDSLCETNQEKENIMRTLMSLIRRAPKRTSAVLAIVAAVVIVPSALFAWGPIRDTFTMEHPADHITFNSITNNPNIGDERNFVGIRESGTANQWSD